MALKRKLDLSSNATTEPQLLVISKEARTILKEGGMLSFIHKFGEQDDQISKQFLSS